MGLAEQKSRGDSGLSDYARIAGHGMGTGLAPKIEMFLKCFKQESDLSRYA